MSLPPWCLSLCVGALSLYDGWGLYDASGAGPGPGPKGEIFALYGAPVFLDCEPDDVYGDKSAFRGVDCESWLSDGTRSPVAQCRVLLRALGSDELAAR